VKFKHLDERKRNQWKADFPLASSKPTRKKRKFKSNSKIMKKGYICSLPTSITNFVLVIKHGKRLVCNYYNYSCKNKNRN